MKHRIAIVSAAAGLLLGAVWLCSRPTAGAGVPSGEPEQRPGSSPAASNAPAEPTPWRRRELPMPRDPWGPVRPRGADNSACLACHANYAEEPFAAMHREMNVGCVRCHGPSEAHRNDQEHVTAPDVMYLPEQIAPACAECHWTHRAAPRDVIARWLERCPEKTDPQSLVCTDCHGEHRLPVRTVRWDRQTRALRAEAEGETEERCGAAAPPAGEAAAP